MDADRRRNALCGLKAELCTSAAPGSSPNHKGLRQAPTFRGGKASPKHLLALALPYLTLQHLQLTRSAILIKDYMTYSRGNSL